MRRIHVAALIVLALCLGLLAAGCLDGDETTATAETVVGTVASSAPSKDDLPALELTGDEGEGKKLFASSGCGGCHALADAGANGNVGPNLDEAKPDYTLAVTRVTKGKGAMPAFEDQLEPQQIADVAAYVTQATSGS